jgi:hypothetical protein
MSCDKQMKLNISIKFHLPFVFDLAVQILPVISKIWPAFGHWQPAISRPDHRLNTKHITDSSYSLWRGMKTGQKSQLTFNPLKTYHCEENYSVF